MCTTFFLKIAQKYEMFKWKQVEIEENTLHVGE